MEDLLSRVLGAVPQLALGVLFLVALYQLFREFRTLRGEVRISVEDAVNAKLGSLLGSFQLEAATAARALDEIRARDEQIRRLSTDFETRLEEQQREVEMAWQRVKGRLVFLEGEVPTESSLTSRDLTVMARSAPFEQMVTMLAKVLDDPDATSPDLEIAGDIARQRGRFRLAERLYKRAVEMDPESDSARLEYLCLSAERDHQAREKALGAAIDLVKRTLSAAHESRVANVFLRLRKYAELEAFCRDILAADPPRSSPIYAQAFRDLGVALQHRGEIEKAAECYQSAFDAAPDDENVLSAYISFLRERKDYTKLLELAYRLVLLDALDGQHYVTVGEILADLNRLDEAIQWYEDALEMLSDEASRRMTQQAISRLKRRQELLSKLPVGSTTIS